MELTLLKSFVKDKSVASVTPTSDLCVKRVCKRINFSKPFTLVEYGPGTGVFTNYLLEKAHPESKILAIEKNKTLANVLKKANDERLEVFHDDASNVKKILKQQNIKEVDYILSAIPFSLFSSEQKDSIIKDSKDILSKEGKLLVCQVSKQLKPYLHRHFDKVEVDFEVRNFPPLFVFEAKSKA